jgi:hypothetical protein
MKPELKKLISEHLRDSITREDLTNREAAEMLKIQPGYISLVFNEKHRDSCPANAWEKLEAWHTSRQTLKEWQNFGQYVEQIKEDKTEPKETPVLPIPGPENEPEKIKPVKVSKPKVKQKRKTDPDKIQQEAFSKYSSTEAPFPVIPAVATPEVQFTDTARLKVALDIEINLVVNGQKVQVK